MLRRLACFALPMLAVCGTAHAQNSTAAQLAKLAPDANPKVLQLALDARNCAAASLGATAAPRLAVIDYSYPSTKPRLWVFDLAQNKVLFHEVVAHGQGTGENMAVHFSNKDKSHQSSLGLFRTADTYIGKNGYSLRMQGLEPGTNDAAMARAIVMHGAPYVNVQTARARGRLGRSLKNGQMIFSYYPDSNWLAKSPFINCKSRAAAATLVAKADVANDRVNAAP